MLSALLLSLAGASRDVIAHDYLLTRVGVEPGRGMLLQTLKAWKGEWIEDTPGMEEFVQVKGEIILGCLDEVQGRYGGVEVCVEGVLGLTGEDVERIVRMLRGKCASVVSSSCMWIEV